MALNTFLVDMQPQLGGFRHSTNSLYVAACERFRAKTRQLVMISASIGREARFFVVYEL